MLHDEPIYHGEKIIGRTTSGNYSFNYKKNLAFGYIDNKYLHEKILKNNLYIEVEKHKYLAEILSRPLKNSDYKII